MDYFLFNKNRFLENIYSVLKKNLKKFFYLNQGRIKINIYIIKFFKELDHFYINCLPKT